jgi:hypothetical protein
MRATQCEYRDCDELAIFEFGVGNAGVFKPTRQRLKLCRHHAHVMKDLGRPYPDSSPPHDVEMGFLEACGLVPDYAILSAVGECDTCGYVWHGRGYVNGPLTWFVPCATKGCRGNVVARMLPPVVAPVPGQTTG